MPPKLFLIALTVSILTVPLGTEAQQLRKIPRIGYLTGSSLSASAARLDAFRQGLRELGYIEGQNIAIEYQYAEGNLDRIPGLVAELVRLKVDVITSSTDQAISAAQQATQTIPIVFAATGDPVAAGFVASLAQPSRNITGTTTFWEGTILRRIELLGEAVPKLSHLAVLWNPGSVTQNQQIKEIAATAKALGLKFQPLELPRLNDLDKAFSALSKDRPDGLLIFTSPIIRIHARRITEFAGRNRLPTMYEDSTFVQGGGLMAYGPDIADLDRRAASYVDKVLKGAKPADLPVEQPTKFELVINLKAAKQIGLTILPNVLLRADRMIK